MCAIHSHAVSEAYCITDACSKGGCLLLINCKLLLVCVELVLSLVSTPDALCISLQAETKRYRCRRFGHQALQHHRCLGKQTTDVQDHASTSLPMCMHFSSIARHDLLCAYHPPQALALFQLVRTSSTYTTPMQTARWQLTCWVASSMTTPCCCSSMEPTWKPERARPVTATVIRKGSTAAIPCWPAAQQA